MATVINELLMQPSPLGEYFAAGRGLAGPASYPTGGYLLSAKIFALLSSFKLILPETTDSTGTYYVRIFRTGTGTNNATVIVKWFVISTNNEVANTTNLSGSTMRYFAIGN